MRPWRRILGFFDCPVAYPHGSAFLYEASLRLHSFVMNHALLKKGWEWLRVLVTAFLALAIFNYPRTWWQELICATALGWSGLLVVAVCFDIAHFRAILSSWARVALVALQVLCIARTGQMVMPYLYAQQKSYPRLVYSAPERFLFIDISERSGIAHAEALKSFIDVEDPSMIIITRYADAPILAPVAERFPSRFVSSPSKNRVVEVLAKLKPRGRIRLDYGYAALPAVAGEFLSRDGVPFVIGAFDLLPPWRQEDFLRSRLTSRRIASALKYTSKPRIVFGSFRTSRTSQIVDMYPSQLRLRELFFDSGISIVPELLKESLSFEKSQHVFTARNIVVSRVIESRAEDGGFAAVLFDARVPREPTP